MWKMLRPDIFIYLTISYLVFIPCSIGNTTAAQSPAFLVPETIHSTRNISYIREAPTERFQLQRDNSVLRELLKDRNYSIEV